VLALFVPIKEAWRLHQRFKFSVIAGLAHDAPTADVPIDLVRAWLESAWQGELEDATLMRQEAADRQLAEEIKRESGAEQERENAEAAGAIARPPLTNLEQGRMVYGG
jgi:hypothetical protein